MPSNPRVQTPEHPFRSILPLQTRFNDIDALHHINNSVYLAFADLGKFRYMQHVLGFRDFKGIAAVIVNINCDFTAPATIDEPLQIATQVESIGPKSIHILQHVTNRETGEVKCVVRTVLAGWDPVTGSSAPISPLHIQAIEQYEGRKLIKK